jgi:leucyl-tRNA synthetase
VPRAWVDAFVRVLAPFAPHLGEELWRRLGHTETITFAPWPEWDEAKLAVDTITIAVQVNGKLRDSVDVPADAGEPDVIATAKASANVQKYLEGKTIRREIYVKGRLVNLVVA